MKITDDLSQSTCCTCGSVQEAGQIGVAERQCTKGLKLLRWLLDLTSINACLLATRAVHLFRDKRGIREFRVRHTGVF